MTTMAQVPGHSPLMRAWMAYQQTNEYRNAARWAVSPEHTNGSLWTAFVDGFTAGQMAAQPARPVARVDARGEAEIALGPDFATLTADLRAAAKHYGEVETASRIIAAIGTTPDATEREAARSSMLRANDALDLAIQLQAAEVTALRERVCEAEEVPLVRAAAAAPAAQREPRTPDETLAVAIERAARDLMPRGVDSEVCALFDAADRLRELAVDKALLDQLQELVRTNPEGVQFNHAPNSFDREDSGFSAGVWDGEGTLDELDDVYDTLREVIGVLTDPHQQLAQGEIATRERYDGDADLRQIQIEARKLK